MEGWRLKVTMSILDTFKYRESRSIYRNKISKLQKVAVAAGRHHP